MSGQRDITQMLVRLQDVGWKVTVTTGKSTHYKIVSPEGKTCFAPTSTGDIRAFKNVRAKLRRLGADL